MDSFCPPNKTSGELIFDVPGPYLVPTPFAGTLVIQQWGEGAAGNDGTATTSAGSGGGSGSYAKYTLGGGLTAPGTTLLVQVAPINPLNHFSTVISDGGTTNYSSRGGVGSLGGTNVLDGDGIGITVIDDIPGNSATPVSGTTGTDGANAPGPDGGIGGVGGAPGEIGLPGTAPGAGGGGGGFPSQSGGTGGRGKIIITWG